MISSRLLIYLGRYESLQPSPEFVASIDRHLGLHGCLKDYPPQNQGSLRRSTKKRRRCILQDLRLSYSSLQETVDLSLAFY